MDNMTFEGFGTAYTLSWMARYSDALPKDWRFFLKTQGKPAIPEVYPSVSTDWWIHATEGHILIKAFPKDWQGIKYCKSGIKPYAAGG